LSLIDASLLALGIALLAYVTGSVPFGYIAGRLSGIDVRMYGSGNIGATNVLRVLGKPWGFAVFFADAAKGFIAVRAALMIIGRTPSGAAYGNFYAILAAAACVAGHSFPIWLRFRGGKGVATSAGAIFGVMPIAAATIFAVWVAVFFTTKYVSLASVIAAIALPVTVCVLIRIEQVQGTVLLYFSTVMTALVVWRHRSNMSRLVKGTEPRSGRK
jgi:acyl phosphate:glycerol-3-phosphate acyltransferase